MIAESKPEEKDVMVQLVMNILNLQRKNNDIIKNKQAEEIGIKRHISVSLIKKAGWSELKQFMKEGNVRHGV